MVLNLSGLWDCVSFVDVSLSVVIYNQGNPGINFTLSLKNASKIICLICYE